MSKQGYRACYRQGSWSVARYVSMPIERVYFVLLLVGDEVLAILEALDLELLALGSGVNVLDIVYHHR